MFPLIGTDEELKAGGASALETKIRDAGGIVASSAAFKKGAPAYRVRDTRQGYWHLIQFELDPLKMQELRRDMALSGAAGRFTITAVKRGFQSVILSSVPARKTERPARPTAVRPAIAQSVDASAPRLAPSVALVQEKTKAEDAPKVTIEEIDKKLEEILGGN